MSEFYVYYCKQCRKQQGVPIKYSAFWSIRRPPKPVRTCSTCGEDMKFLHGIYH